jgi:prepilin signal peptidase PulO-like enzyme (type II secretory pathway)
VIASIILLFIYIYDARTMLIPNAAVWSFNILAFISVFLNQRNSFTFMENIFVLPSWWAVAAGPLATLPLFLIWFLSRGKVMGFGDVKLTLGIGWLLGIAGGLSAVTYAFWVGAVVSLGILSAQRLWKRSSPEGSKSLTMKSAVPFGPFLILGWLIALFSGITLF